MIRRLEVLFRDLIGVPSPARCHALSILVVLLNVNRSGDDAWGHTIAQVGKFGGESKMYSELARGVPRRYGGTVPTCSSSYQVVQ